LKLLNVVDEHTWRPWPSLWATGPGGTTDKTFGIAEVVHDPLSGPANTQVNIRSGGSFGMALHQAEPAYVVSGRFSGGTITVINPARTAPIRSTP
jgi:hypothetical protein